MSGYDALPLHSEEEAFEEVGMDYYSDEDTKTREESDKKEDDGEQPSLARPIDAPELYNGPLVH